MDKTYSCKIVSCTKENLSVQDKIKLKDLTDALNLNTAVEGEPDGTVPMHIDYMAELAIHNEKSENVDYNVFVFVTTEGRKYYSSSDSLINQIQNIADELADAGEELGANTIEVYAKPSKNFQGRAFLTARLA